MRIREIAKELNVPPKDVMAFLNEKLGDSSYTNAAKGLTSEEEALVRAKFGSAASAPKEKGEKKGTPRLTEPLKEKGAAKEKKKETEKKPEKAEKETAKRSRDRKGKEEEEEEKKEEKPAPKPQTLLRKKEPAPEPAGEPAKPVAILRRREERSYVPEEKRGGQPVIEHSSQLSEPSVPGVPEETVPPPSEPSLPAEPLEPQPAEPEISPEDEALLRPSFRIEPADEERPVTPAAPHRLSRRGEREEEDDRPDHRYKKRKVVIPDAEEEPLWPPKKPHGVRSGDKRAKERGLEHLSGKTKVRGVDLGVFKEEEEETATKVTVSKKTTRPSAPAPRPIPNPTKAIKKIIRIEETIVVSELARRMGVKAAEVIKKLLQLGETAGINDRVNLETAAVLAGEFGFQVENVALSEEDFLEKYEDVPEVLVPRPPVVTVMGHVDHGKTKLLDAIRNTNVVDKEAGGITQHIGAYTVELEKGKITFLDTPGHEAFTAMRSRGAQATDVVVLIVAADDGVMPQTVEAINHARAADVPIIVAINKIDKPEANPEKVRQDLLKYDIVPEEWGGSNLFVEISAKQRINIDKLLEAILLQVEMMDLKANPNKPATGIVIESRMDPGRGPVATALIKDGTLRIGDLVATATAFGYVRSMTDWRGNRVQEAGPSMAVEITGLDSVPPAGEMLYTFSDEKKVRGFVDLRKNKLKQQRFEKEGKVTLDNLFAKIENGDVKNFNLIIKGDVDGSVEAIVNSVKKIEHEKLRVRIIHSGVGGITENDVLLASASKAIIFGFNVRVDSKAKQTAETEQVDIRIFSIIYDLIDAIKAAMTGTLAPIVKEQFTGVAEVRQIFRIAKVGTIAGCMVADGRIVRGGRVKLIRDNIVIYEGTLSSLKRFKDDVKEVKAGLECGMSIENYNDIKEGDLIECYISTEVADTVL